MYSTMTTNELDSSSTPSISSSNSIINSTIAITESSNANIPENYQIILLSFAYGIISLLALVGNASIIYIVIRNRHMHSVTNYFICNLALADCLVACFAIPFQFQAAVLQKWVLPKFLCKLAPFVQILSVDVSIYTLVAVSLDRYYVMLHPLKPKLSTKSALIIFIVIWLIALGSSIPSLFFFDVYLINDHVHRCLPYDDQKQQSNTSLSSPHDIYRVYVVYNIYSQYIIPFIIISCAYFRIGSHLYFSKPVGQTKYQEVIARNKRKVLKMLFVVVALFLICWFPLQLYNFLHVYKPEINDFKNIAVLWLCANWLAMSNSCHNPFIYGFCSARFNREFRKLYSCLPLNDNQHCDGEVTESNRTHIISTSQGATRRAMCQNQNYSSSSTPQPGRSRQDTATSVNSVPMSIQSTSLSTKTVLRHKSAQMLNHSSNQRRSSNNHLHFDSNFHPHNHETNRKYLIEQDLVKEHEQLLVNDHPPRLSD